MHIFGKNQTFDIEDGELGGSRGAEPEFQPRLPLGHTTPTPYPEPRFP